MRVFPMHGASAVVEEPRIGQDEGTTADRADHRAMASEAPQMMVDPVAAPELIGLEPRADHQHVDLVQFIQGAVDGDANSIAGHDLLAVDRDQLPFEQLTLAHAVGRAERFEGGGKRHHGKLRHQKKRNSNCHAVYVPWMSQSVTAASCLRTSES